MALPLAELKAEQEALRARLVLRDDFDPQAVRTVAGGDVTFLEARRAVTRGLACLTLHSFPGLELLDRVVVEGPVTFPYVPGFLAYRELPLLLEAWRRLGARADVVLLDAQGIAHPRGLGLASHFGVVTGSVAVGCAKSHLYGEYVPPPPGGESPLLAPDGRRLGTVLRPGTGRGLLFVSPGHRVSVATATALVRACLGGRRLPAPTRAAHALLQQARRAARETAYE